MEKTLETKVLGMTSYLKRLSELLLGTQATDHDGNPLPLDEAAQRAVNMILSLLFTERKIMLVGNGGSAAIVNHMQNDLCKAVGVRAMVFTDVSLLTAVGNDQGYAHVFERPTELWADSGDVMVAVSSSGQSENILRAVKVAIERGCRVITLTGFKAENALRRLGDVNFYVPSETYGYVETAHAVMTHVLTDCCLQSRPTCEPQARETL